MFDKKKPTRFLFYVSCVSTSLKVNGVGVQDCLYIFFRRVEDFFKILSRYFQDSNVKNVKNTRVEIQLPTDYVE